MCRFTTMPAAGASALCLTRPAEVVVEALGRVVLAGLGEELDVAVDHLQVGVAHELHQLLDRVAGRHQQRGVGVAALVERDAVEAGGVPGGVDSGGDLADITERSTTLPESGRPWRSHASARTVRRLSAIGGRRDVPASDLERRTMRRVAMWSPSSTSSQSRR